MSAVVKLSAKPTREELIRHIEGQLEPAGKEVRCQRLYQIDAVKRNRPAMLETIAEQVLRGRWMEGIAPLRQKPYRASKHTKDMPEPAPAKWTEVHVAIQLYRTQARFLDYQVPLKEHKRDAGGEADLLMWEDGLLWLVELKWVNKTDSLLRSVLEVETYRRMVEPERLYQEYGRPERNRVGAALLLYRDPTCRAWVEWVNTQAGMYPKLHALMQTWGIRVYSLDGSGENPRLEPWT